MTAFADVNAHTLSGVLKKDATITGLSDDPDPSHYKFRFRIGTMKIYRHGNDVRTRMTYFNIQMSVPASGKEYYRNLLRGGCRVLVIGEQLIDEYEDEGGRRYFQFIRAQSIQLLQDMPSLEDHEPEADEETAGELAPPPAPPAHPPKASQPRGPVAAQAPPAPPRRRQYPEREFAETPAPPRAHRVRDLPDEVDKTHFNPNDW